MNLKFRWVDKKARYRTGESVYLGKICVGNYSWNSGQSQSNRDALIDWVGNITLPSLGDSSKRVYGSTPYVVRARIEQIITSWFEEATKE